jgi:hypothetical protein
MPRRIFSLFPFLYGKLLKLFADGPSAEQLAERAERGMHLGEHRLSSPGEPVDRADGGSGGELLTQRAPSGGGEPVVLARRLLSVMRHSVSIQLLCSTTARVDGAWPT